MVRGELKTPDEWCEELDAQILDPDGWRQDNMPWDLPITREEFDQLMVPCTINSNYYIPGDPPGLQYPVNRRAMYMEKYGSG